MNRLRYGLIGCGKFGRFCLEEYARLEELECTAVADANAPLAEETAERQGVGFSESPEALIARTDIDIVHIATPPGTHAELASAALNAGKHVLCEKPLALTMEDADRLADLATAKGLILAVNLIMRYNPLCGGVKQLVEHGVLGRPLFAQLVNCAQDETLPAAHWFWSPGQSGGIFVEHGVHFFDLFEWWFGPGTVISADRLRRPPSGIVDQVRCSVQYGDQTLADFYHGFHQMHRRDEQHWRIVFETGTLEMKEWVPTSLTIDFDAAAASAEQLREFFPGSEVTLLQHYEGRDREAASHGMTRTIDVKGRLTAAAEWPKMKLYGEMVRALMSDQIMAIHHPGHHRRISEANGVNSLRMATRATYLAEQSEALRNP